MLVLLFFIFMADTKMIFGYNFVSLLKVCKKFNIIIFSFFLVKLTAEAKKNRQSDTLKELWKSKIKFSKTFQG